MFVKVQLKKNVFVQPHDLGPAVMHRLEDLLRTAVEGTRVPDFGLVVSVTDIVGAAALQGRVLDTGAVLFELIYEACVFRLLPGEVLDGFVEEVSAEGVYVNAGATSVFVSRYHIPGEYNFESDGAAQRFVTPDEGMSISAGDCLRMRVVNETPSSARSGALATIDGPFLGPRL